jgi:hypothetical protein
MQPAVSIHIADAAYIAGLIDGEGTITLTRLHRNEHRRLVVSISNTDRSLLDYVRITVSAGRITSKSTRSEKHTPSFAWQVTSRQALAVLHAVHPYLRTYKALRASLALEHYLAVTPRNGRYDAGLLHRRAEFEQRFFAIQPAYALTLRLRPSISSNSDPECDAARTAGGAVLAISGRRANRHC